MLNNLDFKDLLISMICLTITIVSHELAHGYVALLFGDDTAKRNGRLSLNPLVHFNLFGFISLLLFKFGWANPVPVNFSRLKPNKLGFFLVSFAGIFTNLIIGFASCLIYIILLVKGYNNLLTDFFLILMMYNVSLAVFNLLPFPPLDGAKIAISFLPYKTQHEIMSYEKYTSLILLFLIFSNTVNNVIGPIIQYIIKFYISIGQMIILW